MDWAVGVLDALHGLDLPGAAEARGRVVGPRRRAGDELVCCECAARHDDEGEDDDLRWLRGVVLHCPACGETNRYDLDRVYATRRAGEPDPYLGDDLECPSCGAAEGLAPSPLGAG